jgi:hypothetical protein
LANEVIFLFCQQIRQPWQIRHHITHITRGIGIIGAGSHQSQKYEGVDEVFHEPFCNLTANLTSSLQGCEKNKEKL